MTDPRVREAAEACRSGDLARARRVIHQVLEESDRDPLPWRVLGTIAAAAGDMASNTLLLRPFRQGDVLD